MKFLNLRAIEGRLFLGALDYMDNISRDGNKPKSDLLFALCLENPKKNSSCVQKKNLFFCWNELHLVRGFQKGITLGVKKSGTCL